MMRTLLLGLLAETMMLAGCATDDAEVAGTSADAIAANGPRASFDKVVLGRIYQHEEWTLPAADTYRPDLYASTFDRRVAYVCDAYVPLDPTYVSGLLRFDEEETITRR